METGKKIQGIEIKKLKCKQLLPRDNNFEEFYKNEWAEYRYYNSETVTDDKGVMIEKGFKRVVNAMPHSELETSKTISFIADCKVKNGLEFTEKHYIEDKLNKISSYKDIKFKLDLNTRITAESYIEFLNKRLIELQEKPNEPYPEGITIPARPLHQFTDEQIEIMKSYFLAPFKGMGCNQNYFDENLLIDLKKIRTGIEYAKIAKLIYESPKSAKEFKKEPFSTWYEIFCNLMGIRKCKYRIFSNTD